METTPTQTELDLKEVEKNVAAYLKLQEEKAVIDTQMRAFKKNIFAYAIANKDKFTGNKLKLETGELKLGTKTVIHHNKKFDLLRFFRKFPAMISWEFKVAPMKALFAQPQTLKVLKGFGLRMEKISAEDRFEIKTLNASDEDETSQS
jgi:hypothetical protein